MPWEDLLMKMVSPTSYSRECLFKFFNFHGVSLLFQHLVFLSSSLLIRASGENSLFSSRQQQGSKIARHCTACHGRGEVCLD